MVEPQPGIGSRRNASTWVRAVRYDLPTPRRLCDTRRARLFIELARMSADVFALVCNLLNMKPSMGPSAGRGRVPFIGDPSARG